MSRDEAQFAFGLPMREIYLDVETLRLSEEVEGGWSNIKGFGLAVAVTWDRESGFRYWYEGDVGRLVAELGNFDLVVTFNGDRFDFEVLGAYAAVDHLRARSFDVMESLAKQLGYRVKLDRLARDTLGSGKSGSGIDAVRWWRAGEKAKVAEYCQKDVEILRELVEHGRAKGHVVLSAQQIPVNWKRGNNWR